MTLEEKGPIKPPPELSRFSQEVSKEIQSWKNIIAATHWDLYDRSETDGADFYVNKEELGHIHLDGEVHLATGKKLATLLLDNKLALKFPYGNDWVLSSIESAKDVSHATWLFQLNYKRIIGVPIEKLVEEINNYKASVLNNIMQN